MSMRWADSDSEDEAFIAAATAAEEAERAAMQPSGLNDGTVPGLGQVSKHLLASGCLRVRLRIGTKAQLRTSLNSTVSLPLHSPPPQILYIFVFASAIVRPQGVDQSDNEDIEAEADVINSDSESEGEQTDEEERERLRRAREEARAAKAATEKKTSIRRNLSKKELKDLKEKEAGDLEDLLNEFGISPAGSDDNEPVGLGDDDDAGIVDSASAAAASKRRRKKKKGKGGASSAEANESHTADASEPVDVAAVLKAKAKAKGKSSGQKAAAIAAKEAGAKKEAEAKKKKKKKDKNYGR